MGLKRESELKAAFTKELKRQLPSFIMLQHATAGAPDRSITGNGRTTFYEFKHGTPNFESPGLQEIFCIRLDEISYCRYIVWQEVRHQQFTLIVTPKMMHERVGWHLLPEVWCEGYDMEWLVGVVKKAHGL